jgi:hypothetical protein
MLVRGILGSKRDEAKRKLHNEELHNLCSLSSVIRMIKSRKMRLAGHVAWLERMHVEYLWESQKERDHYKDQGRWMDNIRINRREVKWGVVD